MKGFSCGFDYSVKYTWNQFTKKATWEAQGITITDQSKTTETWTSGGQEHITKLSHAFIYFLMNKQPNKHLENLYNVLITQIYKLYILFDSKRSVYHILTFSSNKSFTQDVLCLFRSHLVILKKFTFLKVLQRGGKQDQLNSNLNHTLEEVDFVTSLFCISPFFGTSSNSKGWNWKLKRTFTVRWLQLWNELARSERVKVLRHTTQTS